MVMAMPYEDRLAYLHRRLKDLVFDIHGIVIEESASTNRTVSAVDEDWPHHRIRTGSDKEELALDNQYREEHRWPLTFLERIRGDLNFDGVVSISDITPIAVNFGAHYEDDPLNPHWVPVEVASGRISYSNLTRLHVSTTTKRAAMMILSRTTV